MTRQNINTGTIANDGTGDTLRIAGDKINANFGELYEFLGGSDNLSTRVQLDPNGIKFIGNTYDTILDFEEGSSAITINLPSEQSTLVGDTAVQTITNKTLSNTIIDQTFAILDQSTDHQYNLISSELVADRDITIPSLTSNDVFTFNSAPQTLTNKTLTEPSVSNAAIVGGLKDNISQSLIDVTSTPSAINHMAISNAALNSPPIISAVGSDTHINLALEAKGDGAIEMISSVRYKPEVIVSAGQTLDPSIGLTKFDANGAITATLPDPNTNYFAGGIKVLANANSVGNVTVTPTTFMNGTSITIRLGGVVSLMWIDNTTGWFLAEPKAYPSSDVDALWYVTV